MKLSEHLTLTGGVGIAVAAVMILLLPLVLPKGERGRTKLPLILLLLYVAIVASRSFLDDDSPSHEPLKVAGVFFLGSSMARSGFLLVLHSVITRTLGGNVPRIVRDLVQALLFMGVLMLTLRAAGVEPSSLLTTSALLTAVIGLSLQDTLGNLFAGLAIQAQRPFRVGDWIQYDDTEHHIGRIVEMNWRAVKVETLDKVEMTVPNATLAKSSLQNYSMPTRVARRHAYVEAPYDRPPERVIPQLVDAVRGVAGVLPRPPADAVVKDFTERGVRYDVRYYIDDFEQRELIGGQVRERLWYALQRMGVEIPVPQRLVRMFDYTEERLEHEAEARVDERDRALKRVDFLRALPDEARHRLAEGTHTRMYAPGETIIVEGEAGEELFIVRSGEVRVEIGRRKRHEVARLGPGQFFGEMSLMTGEHRKASVRAVRESEILVIDREALRPVLEEAPELAETISRVLAEREEMLDEADDASTSDMGVKKSVERETSVLLWRIRKLFSLKD
ncbi:MAG: hypothetical protein CMH59_06675 [Myxococcales bacterium]|nr:hypothetical protein [Myxococcales bacterium]